MISSLLIKPAGPDCNLACRYCFYRPASALYPKTKHPRMTLEVLRELVRQYMTLAERPAFCWQGGEPTLMGVDFYRSAIALQKKHGYAGQVVANSLQTNAVLLDDEWARLLGRYSFLVGVSLDGPAEVHDHYRVNMGGQPTLAQVLRGMKVLQRAQVEHNALCMVTSLSATKAGLIWDFLLAQGLEYLQFIPCLEKERRTGQLAEFTVSPGAYGEFLCEIFDLWWPERQRVHVRLFDDLLAEVLGRPETKACELRPRCGDYLVVEHNGDVYACDFFVDREHRVGNLTQEPLAELAKAEIFGAFSAAKGQYGEQCGQCEWLSTCCGGCQKHRIFAHGCVEGPTYLCESYRQILAHARPRLVELAGEMKAEADAR